MKDASTVKCIQCLNRQISLHYFEALMEVHGDFAF